MGAPPGCGSSPIGRDLAAHHERLDVAWAHERRRHDLGEPGARERVADQLPDLERRRAVVRQRGVGRLGRHQLVAADAGDLLRDVGLDRDVAAPGRDERGHRRAVARRDDERIGPERDDDLRTVGGGLGLDADPGEELALLVGRELGAQQAVDPRGAERDARRGRARRAPCRRDPGRRRRPPTRRAAGPCGRRRSARGGLLALLEPEARLGAQRVGAGAVRRMLTGSKMADSTMTSVVVVADLARRRRP